jgi:hypothetical protein
MPMSFRYSRISVLLPVLFACACGTISPYQPLPGAAMDKLSSTDVVVPIAQSEIFVFVPASNAGAATGGGLLGALIDVGINDVRTTKANDASKILRDALLDFNFDNIFEADLKASLSQVGQLHVGNVHVVKDVTSANLDHVLDTSNAAAVLFATTEYHVSNDGDVLSVILTASLFPRSDELKTFVKSGNSGPKTLPANALYRNVFAFETKAPGATGDRDHDMAAWSADHGAPMRAALTMATAKLSAMLAADVQRPAGAARNNGAIVRVGDRPPGSTVSSDADGTVARFDDGTMIFATQSMLHP